MNVPRKKPNSDGIPVWFSMIVVAVLLGALVVNIFTNPAGAGVSNSYILGGLLSAYAGIDQLFKRRDRDDKDR